MDDDITAVDDTDAVNEGATISRSAGSSYDIDSNDTDPDVLPLNRSQRLEKVVQKESV